MVDIIIGRRTFTLGSGRISGEGFRLFGMLMVRCQGLTTAGRLEGAPLYHRSWTPFRPVIVLLSDGVISRRSRIACFTAYIQNTLKLAQPTSW